MVEPTTLYTAMCQQFQKQLLRVGLTCELADRLSGLESGACARMLNPATPSGQQAGWLRLQGLTNVLYSGGFVLTLRPRADMWRIRAELQSKLEKRGRILSPLSIADSARLRGVAGKVPIRDYASFAGTRGAAVRNANLNDKQRSRIAKRAARARWRKPAVAEIAG